MMALPPAANLTSLGALRLGCAAAVCLCAAWAMWPLSGDARIDPRVAKCDSPNMKQVALAPLDVAAFRAPLWVIPPPPPAPPGPPAPPPPLRLQLIAIITEPASAATPERAAALLYDPDHDKVFTVHQGDTLQGRRIDKVTDVRVHIKDVSGERILSLRNDQPGGGS